MTLVQGRGEIAVMPAVTAVLLHHLAMDTGTECNVVSTWKREIIFLPSVTRIPFHHCAVDTGTDCNVVSTG